ncbi:hypothetical protein [Aureispira anguillae]|uniref:Uncharacterized protein n=1 Tax=Aureispira anguillae TaxID=2864201 RepID=A0A916DVD2_9BACT|nr:hypothetical protein [Aureispira anguillae]BDS13602.1 hypothetical protein AsAng_0043410 [Aureispira anguillae]
MYSSKLVDVFYSLSKTQLRALRKFVQSPYHNKRQDVIALFELMYKTPLENRIALRKEKAFPKVFGQKKFSADQMDYVMSFLLKVIEQFLVHENSVQDKVKIQVALMEEYRKLGLSKHFHQALNIAKREQLKTPLRDINYYEKAFQIESEQYLFLSLQQRDRSKNLQELSTKLDWRFLSQKLKDACRLLAHQAVAKQQYNFGLLKPILPYIKDNVDLLEHPSISLYYYYYQAVTDSDSEEEYFQKFKKTFLDSTTVFEDIEVKDLYLLAVNYCIKKSNLGKNQYLLELFDFYDAGLKLRILFDENKMLSPFTFNNITKLALRLGKIDWTAEFIETYKTFVDSQYHETYVHNAYSMLYFAQGKYEETMLRLQQVDYKELFITMDAKVLLVKVYYQLSEYDVLESFINSFKVFLRRKDILAYHQEIYKNFIRMTQKLINLPPFNKAAKTKLRTEIEATQKLLEKKWLLEQLQ